jgi:NADH-quinone oxidoreductase subunit H
MLGAVRSLMMLFCLELLLGIFFLCIYVQLNSFNYSLSIILQSEYPYFTIFFLIGSLIIILILLDLNRIPYDFAEAENELIAGFHVEYGAFLFGLFYLSEYFHLFFFSLIINILLIGL